MVAMSKDALLSTRTRAEFVLWLAVPPLLTLLWIKLGSVPKGDPLRWLPLAIVAIALAIRLNSIATPFRKIPRWLRLPFCLLAGGVAGIAWFYLVVFGAIYWHLFWHWLQGNLGHSV